MVRGFEVVSFQSDTFADRLGLQTADLLVELGGASVFGYGEIGFFSKEHAAGERAEAA